jgi:DNA-binding MarR family transcriptional regulator
MQQQERTPFTKIFVSAHANNLISTYLPKQVDYDARVSRRLQDVSLAVKRLQARHHRELNAALGALDISLVQWDALRHLDENPEASSHDLAQLTFQSDQAFGTLANRMINRGLIERVPAPGRAIRHRLTEHGLELRRAGAEIVEQVIARSFAPLSQEQVDQLDDLLRTLLEN